MTLVFTAICSHAPGITARYDLAPPELRDGFYGAMDELRQAVRHGAQVVSLHAVHDDWAMPVAAALTAAPASWLTQLADVAAAVAKARGVPAPLPSLMS
jgi:hypothetical protein